MKWYLIFVLCGGVVPLQAQEQPRRATLPDPSQLTSPIFYRDAFAEGLVGSRPTTLGKQPDGGATSATGTSDTTQLADSFRWSLLASARTLENEVKSLQIQLNKTITTPSQFRGGGYLDVRRMFTELATLFAVIAQYDADVRWQADAAQAAELFARAAANTKTNSIQAFNESRQRKLDLEELVRGGSLTGGDQEYEPVWSRINRASLMQRFTLSYDEGLAVWTANENAMRKNADKILHESELLLLLTQTLTQAGMEDGDDESYAAYARQLHDAARAAIQAMEVKDADALRKAVSDIGQSCSACHDDYRG